MPEELQMKLLNKYKGQSLAKAEYALEVAEGYYICRAIRVQCEKLLRTSNATTKT